MGNIRFNGMDLVTELEVGVNIPVKVKLFKKKFINRETGEEVFGIKEYEARYDNALMEEEISKKLISIYEKALDDHIDHIGGGHLISFPRSFRNEGRKGGKREDD